MTKNIQIGDIIHFKIVTQRKPIIFIITHFYIDCITGTEYLAYTELLKPDRKGTYLKTAFISAFDTMQKDRIERYFNITDFASFDHEIYSTEFWDSLREYLRDCSELWGLFIEKNLLQITKAGDKFKAIFLKGEKEFIATSHLANIAVYLAFSALLVDKSPDIEIIPKQKIDAGTIT